MSNIIDTITPMSSTAAREHLKVNGYDEGSIAEVMVEWAEAQNKPAPAPKPASPRKNNPHTHNDGTTHSHPNSGEHEHDDE
tara:strand:+ start:557 stop:799 length:243 start_codon:yes stop_codon:yes gene_type:complete